MIHNPGFTIHDKGRVALKKTYAFSEKFQTAFDPPPSFSENYIADFATKVRDFATKVRMFILAGLLNGVEQFNMVIG